MGYWRLLWCSRGLHGLTWIGCWSRYRQLVGLSSLVSCYQPGQSHFFHQEAQQSYVSFRISWTLLILSSGSPWCKNKSVKIWVDNSASVFIWNKGYSTSCNISTTLVIAIAKVAAGLGCAVDICKITRCSNISATLADHLSKANFRQFRSLAAQNFLNFPLEPSWIPSSLLRWIENPKEDDKLGDNILIELSSKLQVLGV